jgi:hypothetical protein
MAMPMLRSIAKTMRIYVAWHWSSTQEKQDLDGGGFRQPIFERATAPAHRYKYSI